MKFGFGLQLCQQIIPNFAKLHVQMAVSERKALTLYGLTMAPHSYTVYMACRRNLVCGKAVGVRQSPLHHQYSNARLVCNVRWW
jgi:hypothetical protein